MMRRARQMTAAAPRIAALWSVALIIVGPAEALAWGSTGHRLISQVAIESLPDELPEFLRRPEAVLDIGELGREPDRWRSAGQAHDSERDPAHFIDLDDRLSVLGAVPIDALPATRKAFDDALRAAGRDQYSSGYLPYSIIDGWQQVKKDFSYWRAETAALRHVMRQEDFDWLARDLRLRERLTLRDVGVWSHFVADATQPLHVSIHFNGWGNFPNPRHYTMATTFHAFFEGEFVRGNVAAADIEKAMSPYRNCACGVEQRTIALLRASAGKLVPLYELEKAGAFATASPAGRAFVVERLAAGAAELRDMILDAWRASDDATVGYPEVRVRDVESGQIVPIDQLKGLD